MLSEIVLDDERFSEIAERARARIADIAPYWTDHNVHDPGITLLELFAWMKEMQQFHMDQIGEAHLLAHLRLLGITPLKKKAAEAVIRVDDVRHSVFFPRGSRFFAGEICFEAVTPIHMDAGEVTRLSVRAKGQRAWECDAPVRGEGGMHFPAFGERPQEGSALWMELSGELKPQVTHTLSIRISENASFRRNPIGEEDAFYPLAELSLHYRGARGECAVEIVEDTTAGLLRSGRLRFRIGQERMPENGKRNRSFGKRAVSENEAYYLRLMLNRCEYDMPPMLAEVSLHEQIVAQQRTFAEFHDGQLCGHGAIRLSTYLAMTGAFFLFRREGNFFVPYDGAVEKKIGDEEVFFFLPERKETEDFAYRLICYEADREEELHIGEGRGLPEQVYETRLPELCAEGMCIMMETVKGSGRYLSAECCDDLMRAGPSDAVFFYDEESGSLRFGDCDHGIAPEGRILFAAARSSLGLGGNVKAESILCQEDGERGFCVKNRHPAGGGSDPEPAQQSRERFLQAQTEPARAVTNEDFERLVLQTPGLMIESARVIPGTSGKRPGDASGEECVRIVVKPCSSETTPRLSEAYRRNILRVLEPRRMIGTRIVVLTPEYFGISIFAEIAVVGQEQAARRRIEEAAALFFEEIRAVFGVSVRASAIYGTLNVLDVVTEISSLSLYAQGKDVRYSRSGDLFLPPNGLAYLKECVLSISSDSGGRETN